MKSGKTPRTGRAARLAEYPCQQTGIQVAEETVRVYFHAMTMSVNVPSGRMPA